MDKELVAFGGFVALFIMMFLRVPVGIAMAIVGVGGFGLLTSWSAAFRLLSQSPFSTVTDFNLSVVPMFILMGALASGSGMSRDIFEASRKWLGHWRGGLGLATIVTCGGFAAINGSSVATAATMTQVALPELRKAGYGDKLSTGMIAAGGTLGIMIPPSVIFVLYGIITNIDVTRLFIAGILPGLLGILMYAITLRILVRLKPGEVPQFEPAPWSERFASLRSIWPALLLFLFVIGGLYGGLFTITEAAGMGAMGALIIGVLQGRLGPKQILECFILSLRTSAAIFLIVIGAFLFGYFLTITQTTQNMVAFLVDLPVGPYGVLFLVVIVYIILGALMDELAIILVTIPVVFPAMMQLGFDPVWFGVVIVMTCTLGMITPPIGMNVFVINSLARDVSLGTIYRGVAPFILSDLIRLFLICAFPIIALLLPNTM
ncbi:TRAP transporter large permease [Aquamicrobium sp. LC103]|uniref:TRAP transporter large permease n=1 Tax=Aquamicrobium sp. LC103 TaxID=1120658 RepID=UPI0010C97592|nr:TRAP transporter large permease [Aquamicrobium sp. LC103]TKT76127.1 TRAP transporter large permease [Aquamicrobium sp. LC103]